MSSKKHPPRTLDEWLHVNKLDDWPPPVDLGDESEMKFTPEYFGLSSIHDICKEITSKAPFQINILDELLEQTCAIEEKILEYSSCFFYANKKKGTDSPQRNEKYRASIDLVLEQDNQRQDKIKEMFILKVRNIEHIAYPGFFNHEVTPLPGSLEAPHLLNYVTALQNFSSGFKKNWKKYFLSEASVAIMQDKADIQKKLFHRLSNHFVTVFLNVSSKDKDSFFKFYPDCLGQAIYAAFSAAFPASASKFNHQFRREIVTFVYEWVTGTHPHVEDILKHWKVESLESRHTNEVTDDRAPVLKSSLSFDENSFLDIQSPTKNTSENTQAQLSPKMNAQHIETCKESHPAGTGPFYEKIAFNIHGRSPFIMHYLASKELQAEQEVLQKIVTRTQLVVDDDSQRETYQNVIDKQKKKSKARNVKYQAETSQLNKDCQNLVKQRKKDMRKLKRLQEELLTKHLDIKILSEKIMDMMDKSNFKVQKTSSTQQNEDENEDSGEM